MEIENTSEISNMKLAKSLKNGDFAAYEVLFKKYYAKLCNYVYKLEGNRSLAEDMAQETFAILWEKREQINSDLSIQGYLFKICHNEFLKHTRSKNKERAFLDQIKADTIYKVKVTESLEDDRLEKLRETIEELPPRCKEAFVLSRFEKLKYAEIAEKMGVSKKTVEVHISKALNLIREHAISILIVCGHHILNF